MDIDVARHIVRACFRSARELEGLLSLLKAHCGEEEYATYAKAIATAISSIHLEVMNRVTVAYPQLEKEIEVSITKHERYL
jgi:hypothetical protein